MRGEDLEVDGLAVDALVVAGDSGRLVLDFPLDVTKVVEPPVRDMVELGPFIARGFVWVPVVDGSRVLGIIVRYVYQLQDERSSGHDAAAAGQKISAHNVLEH